MNYIKTDWEDISKVCSYLNSTALDVDSIVKFVSANDADISKKVDSFNKNLQVENIDSEQLNDLCRTFVNGLHDIMFNVSFQVVNTITEYLLKNTSTAIGKSANVIGSSMSNAMTLTSSIDSSNLVINTIKQKQETTLLIISKGVNSLQDLVREESNKYLSDVGELIGEFHGNNISLNNVSEISKNACQLCTDIVHMTILYFAMSMYEFPRTIADVVSDITEFSDAVHQVLMNEFKDEIIQKLNSNGDASWLIDFCDIDVKSIEKTSKAAAKKIYDVSSGIVVSSRDMSAALVDSTANTMRDLVTQSLDILDRSIYKFFGDMLDGFDSDIKSIESTLDYDEIVIINADNHNKRGIVSRGEMSDVVQQAASNLGGFTSSTPENPPEDWDYMSGEAQQAWNMINGGMSQEATQQAMKNSIKSQNPDMSDDDVEAQSLAAVQNAVAAGGFKKPGPTSSKNQGDMIPTNIGGDQSKSPGGKYEKTKKQTNDNWKTEKFNLEEGFKAMMHDGDQQLFNPYGHNSAGWTMYSFKPKDGSSGWPIIAITPASFNALDSINVMLNNIPHIVIKEYFFKNTASTMANFVEKIAEEVKNAHIKPTDEAGSKGSGDAKSSGNNILDKIKNVFEDVGMKEQVIDIPYILYCGLRKKLYGNTYIFPYIVDEGTVINEASNASEWGKGEGLIESLKSAINTGVQMVANTMSGFLGSQSRAADLFPAPTWTGPGQDKISFSFDLILINDHIIRTRNNYMCVNTIINNNRSIQKSVMAFPGALYELWLPTGQRHLMCTGSFKLYPLGLNRKVPKGFFHGKEPGADFPIGTHRSDISMVNDHVDESEVVPDAYKLSCTFTSCLANNLNTSVFQYYVNMTAYEDPGSKPPGKEADDDATAKMQDIFSKLKFNQYQDTPQTQQPEGKTSSKDIFARAIREVASYDEKFDEATYNKRLNRLRTQFGDMSPEANSAVLTVQKTSKIIYDIESFLKKLYDAEHNNLWYKSYAQEEYYTTLKPEYGQVLQKQYGEQLKNLMFVDKQISDISKELKTVQSNLNSIIELDDRKALVGKRVELKNRLNQIQKTKGELTDELLRIDTDLLQVAYDSYDDVMSLRKNNLTKRIFQQVWNEKIMNSYEREKIQYMTSHEQDIYFKDKILDLREHDKYGLLNHPDWFFRVLISDMISTEMKRLISWFKSCRYDDFETVYRIVRKLELLSKDFDVVKSEQFDINKTSLFYVEPSIIEQYTCLDGLLSGNTLYELFCGLVDVSIVNPIVEDEVEQKLENSDTVLLKEQTSEQDIHDRRKVRQDIVNRYWGSETELTKSAYEYVNETYQDKEITVSDPKIKTIGQLKETIIMLKLSGDNPSLLEELLGAFSNQIQLVKEKFVLDKLNGNNESNPPVNGMVDIANDIVRTRDDTVNSSVIKVGS